MKLPYRVQRASAMSSMRACPEYNRSAAVDALAAPQRSVVYAPSDYYKLETKLEFIRRFHDMGAPIAAGTDAIQVFGDNAIGLELLHRAGLSNMDVLVAATSRAAKAMGVEENVGVLRPGMAADFVYLDGNPLADVKAFRHVDAVVLDGRLVVDKRLDFARGIPALAHGAVLGSPVYAD